jgi:hypothetical protein
VRTSMSNVVKTVPAALRVQLMAAWVGDEVIRGVRGRMRPPRNAEACKRICLYAPRAT